MALRIALIILGIVGIVDTAVLSMYSNLNLGVVLPALLGAPLLIIGMFYEPVIAYMARSGAWLKWTLISVYGIYALVTAIIGSLIYKKAHEQPENGVDALIVLGCGVRGERVSLTLKYRLDRAIEYLEANPDTIAVLSGGQGRGENISEAEAMQRYMLSHGIDEARIIKEDRSRSTEQNFLFSKKLIDERFPNGARLAFVTTGFHVLRAELVAKKQGIDITGFGAKEVFYIAPNNYMREVLAIVYYKLTGKV